MQLVIASKNVHKIREYRAILKGIPNLDVLSLLDFPHFIPAEETGLTFKENASIKGLNAAKALNLWVLSDDSGLIVPALGGAPGIYSARYSGLHANDTENRKKLLLDMQHLVELKRQAHYLCHLVLASPSGIKKSVEGICEGRILDEERGCNGFGYDPIFVKNEYSKTFAELEESVKNRISHRRKALDKILITLESLSNSQ